MASSSSQSQSQSQSDVMFRILIASDIHLGYNEKHHERGEDSFRSFEEVLQKAQELDVDMLLLGGDLFHMNKPSFTTFKSCIELLRRYCFGSKPIQFKIISDQKDNFSHPKDFEFANYLDPNLNISIPVFSIHGNHDDPTGANPVSSIEALSSAGLINYFGKHTNYDKINLSPILMKKGNCQLALYGLGSINEERLYRCVTTGKLNYYSPEDPDSWFKVLVVHQNRTKHVNTKYLNERFLSDLPDLVIWGHEHESKVDMDYNQSQQFHVYQPGSTVATSLCEAESLPKHCGLLEIYYDDEIMRPRFKMQPIKLKTVRQMIWESINVDHVIKRHHLDNNCDSIENYCHEKVESMIERAKRDHSGDMRQPRLPLIRLRLEYTDESQKFHCAKFGASFSSRVANPPDIILYTKRRNDNLRIDDDDLNIDDMKSLIDHDAFERVKIEDIINEYFDNVEDEKSQLGLLSENALTMAVKDLVEKESTDAINEIYDLIIKKARNYLINNDVKAEDIREEMKKFRDEQKKNDCDDINKILIESRTKKKSRTKSPAAAKQFSDDDEDEDIFVDDDSEDEEPVKGKGRGRGRGGGRGSRARGRGRGRGRGESPAKRSQKKDNDIFNAPSSSRQKRGAKPMKGFEIEFSDSDD